MKWTVGNSGQRRGSVVGPNELVATLNWIHAQLSREEVIGLLSEIAQDVARGKPPIVECYQEGNALVAAAYFRILPGSVATLGGIRIADSLGPQVATPTRHLQYAEAILSSLCARLRDKGILQIQAVINYADKVTEHLTQLGGFAPVAVVQQLWLDVGGRQTHGGLPAGFAWSDAASRKPNEMIELLAETFVDTLDCPEIGELREPSHQLLSFLEGKKLEEVRNWHVLTYEGQPVGCVLMTRHNPEVVELAYMGLHPSVRGRRIGSQLVQKAIATTQELGVRYLVVAVDESNWPALEIYQHQGFFHHQSKSVFFHQPDAQHVPAADAA